MKANDPQSPHQEQKQIRRIFSEDLKKRIVADLENHIIRMCDVCREYHVTSAAVYKWIFKYSNHRRKSICQVVELESETYKTHKLIERIAELERIIGSKQIQIDVLEKIIELGSEELEVDIKKKFGTPSSNGFERIHRNDPSDRNTDTV